MNYAVRPPRPLARPPLGLTVEERFWRLVYKTDGCWYWLGRLSRDGYGRFRPQRRSLQAHRFSFALINGDAVSGLDHLCRTRDCVRPEHLEPVANKENLRRGVHHLRALTHCIRGHAYDEANTYRRPNGSRVCRECYREKWRAANPAYGLTKRSRAAIRRWNLAPSQTIRRWASDGVDA